VTSLLPAFTPIAIIGMGCRFPKAPNIGAYWDMMLHSVDAISEVPASRWDVDAFYDPRPATPCKIVTRNGGFLEDIDRFDPYFFGISPREAVRLDPQQRLLLEVTWEAMEHAGIPRSRFDGSRTGVFMGVCTDDYITLERGDLRNVDIYLGTGGSRGSTAGRVAFAFNLSGPVAAVDTACSSSLVAVHQACNSLQLGDCDMALAGGVNVVLHPGTAVAFSQANLLSPDGRCKAFDSRANGFVRSEGAGVVLLKPLAKALADGDPVYAVIRASASNNDGASSPFMTPSRTGQAELLRVAYERAGVAPNSVQYVEAHGTGTEVGDPIEVGALSDVLSVGRNVHEPCYLGSSKTNLGHMEAAAGAAGLIKAALCLHHRVIPPNLHFHTPNPRIPWAELPFRVPTEVTRWPEDGRPARAGVNSFGISGTNAHVVLEEAPIIEQKIRAATPSCRPHVLMLSGHTPETVHSIAASYRALANAAVGASLEDLCYSASCRRSLHEHRLGIVFRSREELADKLSAYLDGVVNAGVVQGMVAPDRAQQPAFVFSGIGTQWPTMGRRLQETEKIFRDCMAECDAVITRITGWSVLEEIDRPSDCSQLGRIDIMQPCIFSVQVSLAALWRNWGVEPSAIIGHSLGEIAASHVAGVLSLEDAALVACERSRLMHRTTGSGRMIAVGLPQSELLKRISPWAARVAIAVVNSPTACALSGDSDAVMEILRTLEGDGVFCRLLAVDVACHSPHMAPLQEELRRALAHIKPSVSAIPLYSTLLGKVVHGTELDAEYWARNLREPVQFEAAMQLVLDAGRRAFIEVSPSPALLTTIRANAAKHGEVIAVPSLRMDSEESATLLESAAMLSVNGAHFDWARLSPDSRFVSPPPYVWQKERFWFDEQSGLQNWMTGGAPTTAHRTKHPLLGLHWEPADDPGTHCFETELDLAKMPWLRDHAVEGMPLFPAAGYVELALAASMELFGTGQRVVRSVELKKALFLVPDAPNTIQLVVSANRHARRVSTNVSSESTRSLLFHCYSKSAASVEVDGPDRHTWTLLASGHVDVVSDALVSHVPKFNSTQLDHDFEGTTSAEEFYASVVSGMEFGANFRGVRQTWGKKRHAVTRVRVPAAIEAEARSYRIHPVLLDVCFHSLNALPDKTRDLTLPFAIDRLEVYALPDVTQEMWCEVRSVRTDVGYTAEILLFDDDGACRVRVFGYQTRLLEKANAKLPASTGWLYETQWRSAPTEQTAEASSGRWIIVDGWNADSSALHTEMRARGHACERLDATADAQLNATQIQLAASIGPINGVVYVVSDSRISGADMSAWCLDEATSNATRAFLALLQSCASIHWHSTPPRVFALTRNAKQVDTAAPTLDLGQAPLAGLARVAAVELREFRVTQVDIESSTSATQVANELLRADGEMEVALRGDDRYALRLSRLDMSRRATVRTVAITDAGRDSYRLESAGTGVFDGLALHAISRQLPGPGQIEIRVAAVGLNFLDVLKGLNMAPGLPKRAEFFGMECSGRVVAVGEGVERFAVGDEVIALDSTATGCFRAFLTTDCSAVLPKPSHLTFKEAVTVPIAYQTAWYALSDLGRLRRGESILIHSAAGGVGLAAMEVARQRGAKIFATAGTAEKRTFLKARGVEYVMNSRTLDFAREVMEYTNGRGVDMVLNSLAGEAIPASLALLATGGRFLEIGKRDIYADSQLGLLPFQRNLSFFAVDLLRMRLEKPEVVQELTRDIAQRIDDGSFKALPYTSFPVSQVADAFRYMAKGSHIGKIVVTLDDSPVQVEEVPQPVPIRGDATYLVTGGLGALGLAFARRLVAQGAKHLALIGRSVPTTEAAVVIGELRASGAVVTTIATDVSDGAQVASAIEQIRNAGPPIRGVLHAAGITDDRTLRQLKWEQFTAVFAAKVRGSWNLHRALLPDELDFFVLFSSAASVMGGAGQANYAAANAFLDGLAHYRRHLGLPALSVNWGPWADVGMAALDDNRGARLSDRGLESIPVREGTELLDVLLQQRPAAIAVMPIVWSRWAENFPEALGSPFLSELSSEWSGIATAHASQNGIRQSLLACGSRAAALELLHGYLRTAAAKILRVPEERLGLKMSLVRFGLDSLMAVELKNRIESDMAVNLPAARLLQGPSVAELAEWLAAEVSVTGSATEIPTLVDTLSDDEVSVMLEQLLTQTGPA
jgi:acyl transferase domain-containing protein/NADPH:quinone reductase-like Zn-dependent oxidoreductase/acyl carrier protein